MTPVVVEAVWSDAATFVWIASIILGLTGRLSWKGFFALQIVVQALTVESLVLGEETLLLVCRQCGWLMVWMCWWLKSRET